MCHGHATADQKHNPVEQPLESVSVHMCRSQLQPVVNVQGRAITIIVRTYAVPCLGSGTHLNSSRQACSEQFQTALGFPQQGRTMQKGSCFGVLQRHDGLVSTHTSQPGSALPA